MSIQRIATTAAELNTFGGTYVQEHYDSTRTRGMYKHTKLQTSQLHFPPVSGTVTWINFSHAIKRASSNAHFWSGSIFELKDSSGNRMALIEIQPTMQWTAKVDDGTTTATATQQVLTENSPMEVSLKLTVTGADVTLDVYIGGALQGSATISNTQNAANPDRIIFGVFSTSTGTYNDGATWFGEFIVSSEDTRGIKLRELKPQSFGVYQSWTGPASAVYDDSLATGVQTDIADARVSFGLDNLQHVSSSDVISRVVIQSYAQRGATGLTAMNHFFRYDDGTVNDGADQALDVSGKWLVDDYTTNPKTAVAWTPADLAGIQIGARARA